MKHGWAYMEALTQAIETWSGAVAGDAEAFDHRGMDLRHAVERDLFFRLANNEALQVRFDARLESQNLPPASTDPWCAIIEPYLWKDPPPDPPIPRLSSLR